MFLPYLICSQYGTWSNLFQELGISLNFDNYYDKNAIKEEKCVKMIELLIHFIGR